ncbi:unnamed protein product [Amoebophrya sp. A25]|nr:unnamed protein product [Amoebophrya sp. A25]|eukprot:GSA25T00006019001.1
MVVIEDLDDIEDKGPGASSSGDPAAPTIKKGFLNDGKEIYGPEGSSQGNVTEEQKKAWEKEDQNRELNRRTGSGAYDSDFAKPQWFTSEWPSNCQYNNPGCAFDSLKTSEHESETHQEIIRKSDRWLGIIDNVEAKEVRLSFLGMRDSDLEALVEALRSRNSIENIDISFNHIYGYSLFDIARYLPFSFPPRHPQAASRFLLMKPLLLIKGCDNSRMRRKKAVVVVEISKSNLKPYKYIFYSNTVRTQEFRPWWVLSLRKRFPVSSSSEYTKTSLRSSERKCSRV